MKKTKIFYGNQYVESFECNGRKYTKMDIIKFKAGRLTRKTLKVSAIVCLIGWGFAIGANIAMKYKQPVKVIEQVRIESKIMDKIADCESGTRLKNGRAVKGTATQFRNGQVLVTPNSNGTVDVGMYAINTVHFKEATAQGLNISVQSDNKAFAYWLYDNYGTEPWYSSKSCWGN